MMLVPLFAPPVSVYPACISTKLSIATITCTLKIRIVCRPVHSLYLWRAR